jgi:serine phosphatase RsbU (regulator of sigma subunit)
LNGSFAPLHIRQEPPGPFGTYAQRLVPGRCTNLWRSRSVKQLEHEAGHMTVMPFPRLPEFEGRDAADELVAIFHQALLPELDQLDGTVSCQTRYRAGEHRLLLGGDFIDVVATPDNEVAFAIGDVAGHGPLAAAVALALRASWRTLALGGSDIGLWLTRLDQVLASVHRSSELFVTVCVGVIDRDRATASIASAGHPPPILLTDTVEVVEVTPSAPIGLGVKGATHHVTTVGLPPEWALLAYTDGLIEGRLRPGSRDRYGTASLLRWLATAHPVRLGAADLDQLITDTEAANGGPADDDVAILLLSSPPAPAPLS